ncbi:hypothetical protein DSM112329_04672 [Paraconexibacter sp. AEG42_29]|uniref:Superoxide dismutase n=1 Tax=Paraconexibacter sp. AEG42_29 TaxID=2997339 RepID=A0AAU7B1B7_9ACTN
MRKPLIPTLLVAALAVTGASTTALAQKDGGARPAVYSIPGEKIFPEGIALAGDTFYVGSTTDGTIYRGDVRTAALKPFAAAGANGRTTAIGMKVAGNRLIVAGGATGKIFVLSARTGATLKVLDTQPGTTPRFLNDVAIDGDYAYVTDSNRPILFRFKLGKGGTVGPVERFVDFTGSAFTYGPGFNANGISARNGILTIVQSPTGKLFRVDVRTKDVSEIDLGGRTVVNGDGLLQDGRALYVARNRDELIVPVQLSADGRRGIVGPGVTGPQLQYPTTIAKDGKRLLAVGSQFDKRSAMQPPEPFTVAAIAAPDGRSR